MEKEHCVQDPTIRRARREPMELLVRRTGGRSGPADPLWFLIQAGVLISPSLHPQPEQPLVQQPFAHPRRKQPLPSPEIPEKPRAPLLLFRTYATQTNLATPANLIDNPWPPRPRLLPLH